MFISSIRMIWNEVNLAISSLKTSCDNFLELTVSEYTTEKFLEAYLPMSEQLESIHLSVHALFNIIKKHTHFKQFRSDECDMLMKTLSCGYSKDALDDFQYHYGRFSFAKLNLNEPNHDRDLQPQIIRSDVIKLNSSRKALLSNVDTIISKINMCKQFINDYENLTKDYKLEKCHQSMYL